MSEQDTVQDTARAWARPEVEQVLDGVFRLPIAIPDPALKAVNVYAVVEPDGLTLIDSGWAGEDGELALRNRLSDIGFGLEDVTRFVVTHAHPDHYTQAMWLRSRFGARVHLGSGERPSVEAMTGGGGENQQADLLRACGAADLGREFDETMTQRWKTNRVPWGEPDEWVEDRQLIEAAGRDLEIIATPGHTRGHVVVRDSTLGALFSGDHVLPHITPSIGYERRPEPAPLRSYLASLRLVRDLPDLLLLPAHGAPGPSVHTRVDELLAHHDERLTEALTRVGLGDTTAHAVAAALPWTRRASRLEDLALEHRALAVLETVAHLDVLAHTGRLTMDLVDGVRTYAVVGTVRT